MQASSSNAFKVQDAGGSSTLLNVDSTNSMISLLGNDSGALGAWSTATNSLPAARECATSVTANGYVYVIGGDSSTANCGVASQTVYYAKLNSDGSTGTWQTNTNALPAATECATSVTSNGYVYVMGGSANCESNAPVSTVYYAKLNSDGSIGAWSTATNSLPAARECATSVTSNGYVYVMGGSSGTGCWSSGGSNSTVYYAKLNSDGSVGTWSTNANALPANRACATSVTANGYVYVMGGTAGSVSSGGCWGSVASTTVYYAQLNSNGSTGTWSTNANSLPAAAECATSVVGNGYVYVMGGTPDAGGNSCFGGASLATSNIYYAKLNSNGSTNTWSTNVNSLPAARACATSVIANGYVYVLGGNTPGSFACNGGSNTSTVYYASLARITVGANLDLVGPQGGNLADGDTSGLGSVGGSLTAGDTNIVGALQVQGMANFAQSVGINGTLSVGDSVTFRNNTNSTTAFQIQNSSGTALLTADTSGSNLTVNQGTINVSGLTIPSSLSVGAGANTGGSLSGATTYYYRVTAVTAAGESVPAGEQIMNASSFTPVSAPGSTLSASATSTGDISCDGTNGCSYEVTFYTANGETTASTASTNILNVNAKSMSLSSIPTGATGTTGRNIYLKSNMMFGDNNYHLEATISNNTSTSMTDDGSGSTASCYNCQTPPGSNSARTNTNNASLSWTAVSGATSYKIYRGTTSGQETTLAGTSGTNSFTDTGSGSTSSPSPSGGINFGGDSEIYRSGTNTLSTNSSFIIQPTTNSTKALQVLNSSSQNILQVDNSGGNVTLGTANTVGTSGTSGSPGTPPTPYIPSSWGSGGGTVGTWSTSGQTQLPDNLYAASTVATGGYIYEIGGYSSSTGDVTSAVYSAPIDGSGNVGSWSYVSDIPDYLDGTAAIAVGGYIYVIGGSECGSSDSCATSEVYSAKITPDGALDYGWNDDGSIFGSSIDLVYPTVVSDGTYLYIMGGYSPNALGANSPYMFSAQLTSDGLLSDGWSSFSSLPVAEYGGNAVLYNGYIYMLGGSTTDDDPTGATPDVYSAPVNGDGTVGSWTYEGTTFGDYRWGATTVSYGGYAFQLAGYNGSSLAGITNEDAAYNGSGGFGAWTTSGSPPQMQQSSAVTYNGYVYLIGGNSSSTNTPGGGTPSNLVDRATISGTPDVIGQAEVPATPGSPGSAGTSSTPGNAVNLRVNGNGVFHSNSNSTTAFEVQNANGTDVLAVDTTNSLVKVDGVALQGSTSNGNILIGRTTTASSGFYNTSLGYQALQSNTANYNTAVGESALQVNTNGSGNTALGYAALESNTSGSYNVGVGYNALGNNTSNSYNTAVGYASLSTNNGTGNTAIGYNSQVSGSGTSYNTAIGYNATVSGSSIQYATAVGYDATATSSYSIVLGNSAMTQMNVGIGVNNPTHKLSVVGSSTSTQIGAIINTSTTNSTTNEVLRLGTGAASTTTNARFIQFYGGTTSESTTGTAVGHININNNAVNYATSGADYAEWFDSAQPNLPVGDIVEYMGSGVDKAQAGDSNLVGVVSDTYGFTGGYKDGDETNADRAAVGLTGQVNVNVTGDAIAPGDPVGVSSTPGVGQKMTGAGQIIGYAESSFAGGDTGTVKVYLNPGYYSGPSMADYIQNGGNAVLSDLTVGGTADIASLNVSGNATIKDLTVIGSASIADLTAGTLHVTSSAVFDGDITVGGHIITAGGQPTAQSQTATGGTGAAVSVSGTDTTGTITITTGATPTAGDLAKILFSQTYGQTPHIVLSPSNGAAAGLHFYKGATNTTDFMFDSADAPQANTTYTFDYFIAQ